MIHLVDRVAVGPVAVVSGAVDDVGCVDSVVVVIVVNSVTGSVQTYVTYILCKCFLSFVQRFFVFRKLQRMIFNLSLKDKRCPEICIFTIYHISAVKRP